MKRLWISSPRRSSSNWRLSTAACTASVISTKRTARRNATSGTPAAAHASTTAAGICSRQVVPSSTATAAAPCSSTEPIHARWPSACVPAPSPVVSTSSPPLSRSSGSGISITCAQRSSRSSTSLTGRDLRKTAAHDGQLQDLGEREHTNRHALSRKTRRCVHCDAARQTGGSGWPDWRGPAGDDRMAITDTATHALLIDGEDVAAARTRTVVDPADGEPIAEVADGERRRRRARRRRRQGRVPPRRLEPHHPRRARRGDRPHGRPARGARGGVRPRRVAQHGQAAEVLERLRPPALDRQPALLRRRRPQPRGQGLRRVPRGLHEHDPARAARRLRLDRALELPAQHGLLEGRAGAGGRQRRRAQAVRADAADGADARPPRARGRPAARDPQRRPRPRRRGRRARWPATPTWR